VRYKPQTGGFIPSLSWLYRLKDCYRAVAQNILKLGGVGMTSQGPDPTPRSEPVKQLGNSPMTAAGSLSRSLLPVFVKEPQQLGLLVAFNSCSAVSLFFLSIYHSIYAFFKLLAGHHMRNSGQKSDGTTFAIGSCFNPEK
jgi:hypothetical protein